MSENNNRFPRVLIVSAEPLSLASATGCTLLSLLAGWPKECLAQIYDNDNQPDPTKCSTSRRFSNTNLSIVKVLKFITKKMRRHKSKVVNVSGKRIASITSYSASHDVLSAYSDILPFSVPSSIDKWVAEFRPDVIYSVLGSIRMMKVVDKLSESNSIPIIVHFMDDWPGMLYLKSWLLFIPRTILNIKLRAILNRSNSRLTICQDMAEEYKLRYGVDFESYMNCVAVQSFSSPTEHKINSKIKFGFVGGLHLNRWRSLLLIVTALQELENHGELITLDIYAPQNDITAYGKLFADFSVVGNFATLDTSIINSELARFDVLVHVESFLDDDARYTRLSISTKIPQYMASGRPILGFGPASLSSIRYIEKMAAGLIITNYNNPIPLIKSDALRLISSSELRHTLGLNGFRIATKFHNASIESEKFRSCIIAASA